MGQSKSKPHCFCCGASLRAVTVHEWIADAEVETWLAEYPDTAVQRHAKNRAEKRVTSTLQSALV